MNTGAGPGAHRSRAPVCIPHTTRACGASVCLSDVPTSRHQGRTRQSQEPDGAGRLATQQAEVMAGPAQLAGRGPQGRTRLRRTWRWPGLVAECTARIGRQRRELPWVRVEKDYHLDTDDGTRTLAELFDGRNQLLGYHFMFGPSYAAGCPTCSSIADSVNGVLPHLNARDVTMLFVSQAPLATLQAVSGRWAGASPGCR